MKPRHLFWIILFITIWAAVIDLPKQLPIRLQLPGFTIDTAISAHNIDFRLGSGRLFRDLPIR